MKFRTPIIIILVVLSLLAVKFLFLKPTTEKAGPKGGASKNEAVNVTGFVARYELVRDTLSASGTVLAAEEVDLHPEISGKLTAIKFKEGSYVRKGMLLAKLNDADLQAQMRKLQLQVRLASEKMNRLKSLLDIDGVSQQEYDESSNLIQTLQADMDYVRAQIAKTEIYAPFSGRIGLRQVSAGSYVTPANSIARLQQTDQLKIEFTLPEKYASLISVGDLVNVYVTNQRASVKARVYAIEPGIQQETRSVTVRAIFVNTSNQVYPGAFARVELFSGKDREAMMIPTEAILPQLKGKRVFVSKSGLAIPLDVETGLRNDARIEIVSGLSEGDTILTTGIMSLKPESKVTIVKLIKF
jgi:membrane fusion protein (multidrug efflux system)